MNIDETSSKTYVMTQKLSAQEGPMLQVKIFYCGAIENRTQAKVKGMTTA
jgi:hypothetical protein